jgi:hypothetical protein
MKNDKNISRITRSERHYKVLRADILVHPDVVQNNQGRLGRQPKRKRRINYEKKILNDSFIMGM